MTVCKAEQPSTATRTCCTQALRDPAAFLTHAKRRELDRPGCKRVARRRFRVATTRVLRFRECERRSDLRHNPVRDSR